MGNLLKFNGVTFCPSNWSKGSAEIMNLSLAIMEQSLHDYTRKGMGNDK